MTSSCSQLRFWGVVALAGLFGLALAQPALARPRKSDGVVSVKARANKAEDGKQVIHVTLTVQKGWYVYANPVGLVDYADNQTVVRVAGRDAKIEYPVGTLKKVQDVGDMHIYEDTVTIKAVVPRGPDDTAPLEVTVKLQACGARTCLPPATVTAKVE